MLINYYSNTKVMTFNSVQSIGKRYAKSIPRGRRAPCNDTEWKDKEWFHIYSVAGKML